MSICFGCGENPCVCPSRTGNEAAHQAPPLKITFVISGQRCEVDAGVSERILAVMNRALRESGNGTVYDRNWELRHLNGLMVDPSAPAFSVAGETLFLSPSAGIGAGATTVGVLMP